MNWGYKIISFHSFLSLFLLQIKINRPFSSLSSPIDKGMNVMMMDFVLLWLFFLVVGGTFFSLLFLFFTCRLTDFNESGIKRFCVYWLLVVSTVMEVDFFSMAVIFKRQYHRICLRVKIFLLINQFILDCITVHYFQLLSFLMILWKISWINT